MKKVLSAVLAATMLVTATGAALAQSYRGQGYSNNYGYTGNYNNSRRGYNNSYGYSRTYDRGWNGNGAGAAFGLGLGLFALGAILSSSRSSYDDRYEPRYVPPPAASRYRSGYDDYYYGR